MAAECLLAYQFRDAPDEPSEEARTGALLVAEHYAMIRAALRPPKKTRG